MNFSPYRILVADDSFDTADSTAELLRLDGHEVRAVYDGRRAVEAAKTFRPHVVILDINMPGMNGYEAAAALRRESTDAEFVLVAYSSHDRQSDVDRFRRAGFDHFLSKPAAPGVLSALVEECLGAAAAEPCTFKLRRLTSPARTSRRLKDRGHNPRYGSSPSSPVCQRLGNEGAARHSGDHR